MENAYLITEDNLIGSIADAMLKLKRIKDGKMSTSDSKFFLRLIEFLEKTNTESYKDLLYDKYFVVSEELLNSIHKEFTTQQIVNASHFTEFKNILGNIVQHPEAYSVEESMSKLKEIGLVLLQIKNQRQSH